MRLLKTVVLMVLFLAGVVLASANTHPVRIVYVPPLEVGSFVSGAEIELPAFVVVLGAVLLGVMVTAIGVVVEQARLRLSTRGAVKRATRQQREWEQANARLAEAETELETARSEAHAARERLAETESRLARSREEIRQLKAERTAQPEGAPSEEDRDSVAGADPELPPRGEPGVG